MRRGDVGSDTIVLVGATTLSTPTTARTACRSSLTDLVITSPDPATSSSISVTRRSAPQTSACSRSGRRRGSDSDTAPAEPGARPGRRHIDPRRHSGGRRRRLHPAAQRLAHNIDSVIEECTAVGIDNANGPAGEAWGGAIAAIAGSLTIRGSSLASTPPPAAKPRSRVNRRQCRGRRYLRQRGHPSHHSRQLGQQQLRDRGSA